MKPSIDLNAMRKWKAIPEPFRNKLLGNVYCSNCGVTTIVDYRILDEKYGIVLDGKCKTCGDAVRRVIENE